ncbi:MAG: hypothetical protein LBK47_05700 [Prevotellaceae bacterium]|jgi:hypothetical protein|nr:hypothetical protein [Prevotellaceae bacterium]
MRNNILLLSIGLICATMLSPMATTLHAQEAKTSAKDKQLEGLNNKRASAQKQVNKTNAMKNEVDSLQRLGKRLIMEGTLEQEGILNEQDKLDKRVDASLSILSKEQQSDDPKVVKKAEEKLSAVRAAYRADAKDLSDRFSVAQKKLEEGEKLSERAKSKEKVATDSWKDANAALKAIDDEIYNLRKDDIAREKKEKEEQEKKEAEKARVQALRDKEVAKHAEEKDKVLKAKEKDKERVQAEKDKEAAKRAEEKEKALKVKDKEKEKAQAEKDKEVAKRQAEKEKQTKEREKAAEQKAKEKEKRDAEKAAAAEKREADKAERERIAAEKAKEREAAAAARQNKK